MSIGRLDNRVESACRIPWTMGAIDKVICKWLANEYKDNKLSGSMNAGPPSIGDALRYRGERPSGGGPPFKARSYRWDDTEEE